MTVEALLSRLSEVRSTGQARWSARCPSHDDKRPSLGIRERDDGRILVHCFAGCPIEDILSAAGLEWDALFPERATSDRVPRERKPWSDRQLLEIIDRETIVFFIAVCDTTLERRRLSDVDMSRLRIARERITAIMGALA